MQGKQNRVKRKPALKLEYVSPNQLTLDGFNTPFEQQLTSDNRWVSLSKDIPWDRVVNLYDKQFTSIEGRPPIAGRVVLGAVIIKHMLKLSDRETIQQIKENMFMQYFLGYSSFTNEAPFSPSLFVSIRERLNLSIVNSISEIVIKHAFEMEQKQEQKDLFPEKKSKDESEKDDKNEGQDQDQENEIDPINGEKTEIEEEGNINNSAPRVENESLPHQGKLIMDATVAPQNITFPTDLKLLNTARKKSEKLIDKLYNKEIHGGVKTRTYRNNAHKDFLNTAKKKAKTKKELYKANGKQIRYLRRNIKNIELLLGAYENQDKKVPLKSKHFEQLKTIKKIYEQQKKMHETNTHQVEDRIVNFHQPHVRPIVRGKEGKRTEFGSKLQVSLTKGFSMIDRLSWDNFNESTELMNSVEKYKKRFGYYPKEVLADQIYCTRENRKKLQELNIVLRAKPLGRPRKEALSNQVSPGERNPIEGKFGQAKVGYGLDSIKAKLKTTSESWVASIILVLNLVNLTRLRAYSLNFAEILTFMIENLKYLNLTPFSRFARV